MVRCADCGFVALRKFPEQTLDEAPQEYRDTGNVPHQPQGGYVTYDIAVCFMRAANLKQELDAETGYQSGHELHRRVINKQRECSQFTDWVQGFSPREHQEMIRQEKLLEWQRDREKDDREWRDKQAERDRTWRREDRWSALCMLIVAAVSGVICSVATLIAGGRIPWK